MIKECVMCGKQFDAYRSRDKYCSPKCRNRAYGIRSGRYGKNGVMIKVCTECGKVFETTISHKATCSDECSKKRANTRERILTPEQKARRKEYDHQKWLKSHPEARTMDEIQQEAQINRQKRKAEAEKRKAEREAEQLRIRAEKEKQKQENISHWLEYEAEHFCDVCGEKYVAHYPTSKYCSKKCARMVYRPSRKYKGITVNSDISLKKLAQRDNNQCQICGLYVDWSDFIVINGTTICGNMYPSIDHIVPISWGGTHSWSNIQLAHRGCNSRKSNKFIG